MAYCLTSFDANMRCLQSLRKPCPPTKYSPSPPMTDNPFPRALLLTIQFLLGGKILTLYRSLTKNANQSLKSSLSTLYFLTQSWQPPTIRGLVSQPPPFVPASQAYYVRSQRSSKKPSGHCLSNSDRHSLAFMQIKPCIAYSLFGQEWHVKSY